MRHIGLPIGISDFDDIRKHDMYYVDKTAQLFELLDSPMPLEVFSRPHRFGKTTFQRMLCSFLDIRKDNASLFEGLAVMKDKAFIEKWMNKWPVIYMTLKDLEGPSFESTCKMLANQIGEVFSLHEYLLEDDLDSYEKGIFTSVLARTLDEHQMLYAIPTMMRLLHRHYGKKVFILIDEYDTPCARAERNGYLEEMSSFLHHMFSIMLEENRDLEKAVLTGCLEMPGGSLFTRFSRVYNHSLTSRAFGSAFGFDEAEVSSLLSAAGLGDRESVFKEMYFGYSIGDSKVYTPWDVLLYADDLLYDSDAYPSSYWAGTAEDGDVAALFDDVHDNNEFNTLLTGGIIEKDISVMLGGKSWNVCGDNLWSLLLAAGYLTLAEPYVEGHDAKLRVPNEEVRRTLASCIGIWFRQKVSTDRRTELFDAIWSGDVDALGQILSRYLRKTISYYDYKEDYYHRFLAGLFSGAGYTVKSNREKGEGRPDIILNDPENNRTAVLEVKRAETRDKIPSSLDEAIAQIHEKEYMDGDDESDQVLAYGIACCKKRAVACRVEL